MPEKPLPGNHELDAPIEENTRGALAFRPPKQTRSLQTLNRIASAALDLIEEVGVEGATVSAIVDRAQASVGSFYARFPGKDDLIRHLRDRVWTEAKERWDAALAEQAWEGMPLVKVVEGVVGLLLRSMEADYKRRRVLGRGNLADPELAAPAQTFHEHLLNTLIPLFLTRGDEISHPDPEAAVRFGYRVVVGAIREFIEFGEMRASHLEAGEGPSLPPALGPELANLWNGYLCPDSEVGKGQVGEGVDFFDPWG
jgi:AcrR family transcriptional regulator